MWLYAPQSYFNEYKYVLITDDGEMYSFVSKKSAEGSIKHFKGNVDIYDIFGVKLEGGI